MISKELQEYTKEWVSKQEGREYPCSNQIVTRAIVLRNLSRIEAFEQAYPHFVCYRRNKIDGNCYINPRTKELWRTIRLSENARGYRYYKAIIDSTIDEEIFNLIASPNMDNYCCEVEFF